MLAHPSLSFSRTFGRIRGSSRVIVRRISMQSRTDLTESNDYSYAEFVGCLRHFTRLQSLHLEVHPESEIADSWEFIATFLATTSPPSNLEVLSFYLHWIVPSSKESTFSTNECEFVLRNAEALEPIFNNSLKGLLTLNLEVYLDWPTEFHDKSDHIRTQLSDRKSTRLNSSHSGESRMPSSA